MDDNGAYCLVISTYAVHRLLMADNSLVQVFFSFASILSSIMQKKSLLKSILIYFCLIFAPFPHFSHWWGLSWFKPLLSNTPPVSYMYVNFTSTPPTIVTVYSPVTAIPVIETNVVSVVCQVNLSDLASLTL